ncbi:MAG: hypothetical protein U5N55_09715 [Cypionkella sp.]|nr:hypothetical protein [Cypionkella sp.]
MCEYGAAGQDGPCRCRCLREMGLRPDLSICVPEPEDLCEIGVARAAASCARSHARGGARGAGRRGLCKGLDRVVLALLDAEITAVESEIAAKIRPALGARAG